MLSHQDHGKIMTSRHANCTPNPRGYARFKETPDKPVISQSQKNKPKTAPDSRLFTEKIVIAC
ncbi:hypothetical protein E6H29_07345 [Candidatus Bathyarchaeota archaeon]|nr:MAG: hypothetical protein E6H29_07345 [Candidatus Bathyarchaeota archaeon]